MNLLNVRDGGTIAKPGDMQIMLPAGAPQLIATNMEYEKWIEELGRFDIMLQHAVSRCLIGCWWKPPSSSAVRKIWQHWWRRVSRTSGNSCGRLGEMTLPLRPPPAPPL